MAELKLKPFLKWAGGKTQLLDFLSEFLPPKNKKSKYIEPFLGGGAFFFYVLENDYFDEYLVNDINPRLINLYLIIRDNPEELLNILKHLKSEYNKLDELDDRKPYYYDIRTKFNDENTSSIKSAAYFLFLNKTCFNGLYRENSKGEFNVPIGSYKKVSIYDEELIRLISHYLNKHNNNGERIVRFYNEDYSNMERFIDSDSFVYLDPPYRPVTEAGFTSYSKSGFNDNNQIELSKFYKEMSRRNAMLLLNNSDPKNLDKNDFFFDDLYNNFDVLRVKAKRSINSKGNKRGHINELIIKNY